MLLTAKTGIKGAGVFITGTDTGVGKTIVSAIVIRALLRAGIKAGAMKPFETGCTERGGTLIPADGTFLHDTASMDDRLNLVTPLKYRRPVAPMVAEVLEQRPVEIDRALEAYETLAKKYGFMVVEGIGGLMVPITRRYCGEKYIPYFVSDLIKDLGLPMIIVARPSLGTINHTLLSVYHALNERLEVAGVVLNNHNPPDDTISEKTNPDVLRELCPVPVIGPLPYIEDITPDNIGRIAASHGKQIQALIQPYF